VRGEDDLPVGVPREEPRRRPQRGGVGLPDLRRHRHDQPTRAAAVLRFLDGLPHGCGEQVDVWSAAVAGVERSSEVGRIAVGRIGDVLPRHRLRERDLFLGRAVLRDVADQRGEPIAVEAADDLGQAAGVHRQSIRRRPRR
jgi:hypothetical protein